MMKAVKFVCDGGEKKKNRLGMKLLIEAMQIYELFMFWS